jgi:hypothetical protein
LENSGGGKIEIVNKASNSNEKKVEIRLNGSGSGVIFKASGGGEYTSTESGNAAKEIQEKLDPTLAAKCKELAQIATLGTPGIANSITAMDAQPEGISSFIVTAVASYSGDHGPLIGVRVCASQEDTEHCATTSSALQVSNRNVAKLFVPTSDAGNSIAAGFDPSRIDYRKTVKFTVCLVPVGLSSDADTPFACKEYTRPPHS